MAEKFEEVMAMRRNEGKKCPKCGGPMFFSTYCGVWVCEKCEYHLGLGCCYCGWRLDRETFAEMVYHEGLDL